MGIREKLRETVWKTGMKKPRTIAALGFFTGPSGET